jgi:tetratricopeptide (TPR) repeat protein
MSIQHMRRRFAIQLRYVLWVIIAAFIIGLPLVFVPGGFLGGRREQEQQKTEPSETVAMVNGKPVTRAEVTRSFERVAGFYLQMGQGLGVAQLWQLRYSAFQQAVQNRLLLETAQQQGTSISKSDLSKQAQQMVDREIAQLKDQYKGPEIEQVFASIVAKSAGPSGAPPAQTMSERQFSKWAMQRYLDPSAGLRDDLILQQLRQAVTSQVSANEQDLLQSYDRATVSHIIVMLRPAAKSPGAAAPLARTDEQAKQRAEELLARIKAGADFAAVAKAESDDPAAARTAGLMPDIGRGRMAAEWDKAVFALKPGEVSAPIKVAWGYEIVRMDKISRQLPKDFEKNKQQLLTSFQEQRRGEVWQQYVADLQKKAKVEVRDPEMQAYQALIQGKRDDALAKLNGAKEGARNAGGLTAASVFYQIGQLLAEKKQWKDATDAFAEASDALSGEQAVMLPGGRAEALMALANAYEQLKQTNEAVMWYTAAGEASETPTIHSQLLAIFQKLGKPDLVKKEQEWMASYEQQQQERQAQMAAQQKAAAQQAQGQGKPAAQPASPSSAPAANKPKPATVPQPKPQQAPQPIDARAKK